MAVLVNDEWHSAVIDFECVSSRILGEVEERERFWNNLERIVDRVGIGYRLYVLGDLS